MATKATWVGGVLQFYDSVTHERVDPLAPIVFYDDFLGSAFLGDGTTFWSVVEVNLNTAIGYAADAANGQLSMALDSDVNAEDAVLYNGDQKSFDVGSGLIFEMRAQVSVLPTLTAQIVFGMAGDHNLAKDSVTEQAWFKLDGSGAVVCESDDTTNDNDDVASGTTVLTTGWHIYRIDFTDLSDVRFYIDGAHVASGTTFDMSNLAAGEQQMQPYLSLDKDSDAGVGTLLVDYVRIWQNRS